MFSLAEAYRMLDTFVSVGVGRFDVTFLDIDGGKRGFRKDKSALQLRNSLPKLVPGLTARQNSLVVRPQSQGAALIQLDDLNEAALERVSNVAFLTLATSPGNHQAWIAVSAANDGKDFARRLRKGAGADPSASGATRIAGTVNYKRKYAPDFPTVAIVNAAPGLIVAPEQLESRGLLAAPQARAAPLRASTSRSWPDYERCVQGAPMNNSKTGPDVSRADFMWCLMAAQRGHGIDEIAGRLMELSTKAQENGDQYARVTAENAAAGVARNVGRSRA